MNPSPTGSSDDKRSNPEQILRYLNRISGPFLDRIDLQVDVPKLPSGRFAEQITDKGDSSETVRIRVKAARERQMQRAGKANAQLDNNELERHCVLTKADRQFLVNTSEKLGLSIRTFHRILKVPEPLPIWMNSSKSINAISPKRCNIVPLIAC